MGQKRGRDPKAQAAKANKRTKAVKADGSDDERSVGVEDLNWKTVAMPDRMEDAEGFFGLEEIDGVDIIKTGGDVQFKVGGTNLAQDHRLTEMFMIRPRPGSQESQSSSLRPRTTMVRSGVDSATRNHPRRLPLLRRPPPRSPPNRK